MAITFELLQQLCFEGESNRLDYKRDQYPFAGVSDHEKAELLKDILTLANSFRTQTAYILIGVEQQLDGIGKIIGIPKEKFIDDAKLQQFINEKTNKRIDFCTYSINNNNTNIIQVIEIPVQQNRPFFPLKRFGPIEKNSVYFRVGSSTKLATPDDIARMVKEDLSKINQCEIEISLNIRQNASGDIDFHALEINVTDDEEIIADGGQNVSYQPWMRKAITFSEKVDWLRDVLRTIRVDIALENQSALSAEQLQIETKITKCSNDCINEVEHFPSRPSEIPFSSMPHITTKNLLRNVSLHPGQYDNSSSSLYFEVTHCGSFTLNVTVFGKNMPPFHKEFTINVDYIPISFNSDQINKCFELIQNEDASFLFWDFIRKNIADLLPSPGPQNDDGERERKDQTEYEEP